MDYSCTSKYFLTNQIEKTTSKIIIKMLMIFDFKILSLWFVIEVWWYNTLTRENNWFLNVLVKNFATPTPFGSVSCFVLGICMSNYNLNSFLIHQAPYSKEYLRYLMHRENLGSIWKIGRYPIKVSEVLPISLEEKWQTFSYGKFYWKHCNIHIKGYGRLNATLICVTWRVIRSNLNFKK